MFLKTNLKEKIKESLCTTCGKYRAVTSNHGHFLLKFSKHIWPQAEWISSVYTQLLEQFIIYARGLSIWNLRQYARFHHLRSHLASPSPYILQFNSDLLNNASGGLCFPPYILFYLLHRKRLANNCTLEGSISAYWKSWNTITALIGAISSLHVRHVGSYCATIQQPFHMFFVELNNTVNTIKAEEILNLWNKP